MKSKKLELSNGNVEWVDEKDKLHRDDGPAVIQSNGILEWYQHGKLHRENGPAVEMPDGTKEWWVNGEMHREDGPALEWDDGDKEWYLFNTDLKFDTWLKFISAMNGEEHATLMKLEWG